MQLIIPRGGQSSCCAVQFSLPQHLPRPRRATTHGYSFGHIRNMAKLAEGDPLADLLDSRVSQLGGHGGLDEPRCDNVDANPTATHLPREAPGEPFQAWTHVVNCPALLQGNGGEGGPRHAARLTCLCSAIHRLAWAANPRRNRPDIHDATCTNRGGLNGGSTVWVESLNSESLGLSSQAHDYLVALSASPSRPLGKRALCRGGWC